MNIIFFTFGFIFTGCTSLHAYVYVLAEYYDGNAVLEKEEEVKFRLRKIRKNADHYVIKAYSRTAISYKVKKTRNTTHSFYIIANEEGKYQALSFSATGKWATSEGAWAINTDKDIASYENYLEGKNKWYVEEIETKNGINTLKTITNVLEKMESDVTYYYRASPNKDDKMDNCNTALLETLTEN